MYADIARPVVIQTRLTRHHRSRRRDQKGITDEQCGFDTHFGAPEGEFPSISSKSLISIVRKAMSAADQSTRTLSDCHPDRSIAWKMTAESGPEREHPLDCVMVPEIRVRRQDVVVELGDQGDE